MSNNFDDQRMLIRYLTLRDEVLFYALEYCISDVRKIGLSETETECVKNRAFTFITNYKDFTINNKNNI